MVSLVRWRRFLEAPHGVEDRVENEHASADDRDRAGGAGLGDRVRTEPLQLGAQVDSGQRVGGAGCGVSAGGQHELRHKTPC